jgi:hypothetical protein
MPTAVRITPMIETESQDMSPDVRLPLLSADFGKCWFCVARTDTEILLLLKAIKGAI